MNRSEKAAALHKSGYNCAQAVFAAFADLYGMDNETALKISCPLGGGMGGMRSTCGAVSAMTLLAGLESGTTMPDDKEGKKQNYDTVKMLIGEFENEHGSTVCAYLKGMEEAPVAVKRKPCREYVRFCAALVEEKLAQNKKL